jgi:hypothetical protein
MNYVQARSHIQSGDLLLFEGRGLMAEIIQKRTNSAFSHVGLAWRIGGRVLVLESRPAHKGVTIDRRLSMALTDGPCWVPLSLPWGTEQEIRAMNRLGESYGLMNALRAGFGTKLKDGSFDCSEFVAYVLGIEPILCETPQTLANRFSQKPFYRLEANEVKMSIEES